MGIPHNWNCSIQSVPKSLFVFLITNIFNFKIFFNVMFVINPFPNVIFPRDFVRFYQLFFLSILLGFILVGLPNFLFVCKFIIDTSEPESSCNLIF